MNVGEKCFKYEPNAKLVYEATGEPTQKKNKHNTNWRLRLRVENALKLFLA